MAGGRSSVSLLYVIGQCDPIIIFQGHVSGRVLVVAPVWERPGSVEGGPWVFCLVPTVGPFYSLGGRRVMELSDNSRSILLCDIGAGSKLSTIGAVLESRAVTCPLVLGMDSMFVRCVGQLAITVVLCGGPGSLPTRSATAQPCV